MTNKDWDTLAIINKTDLYGLLNILLKETGGEDGVMDKLNQVKALFVGNKEE